MSTATAEAKPEVVRSGQAFLSCYGEGGTKLMPGDTLQLLGEPPRHTNLLLFRGGRGMHLEHSDGAPVLGPNQVFSLEVARFVAASLAAGYGLSYREEQVDSPVFNDLKNVTFRFF